MSQLRRTRNQEPRQRSNHARMTVGYPYGWVDSPQFTVTLFNGTIEQLSNLSMVQLLDG